MTCLTVSPRPPGPPGDEQKWRYRGVSRDSPWLGLTLHPYLATRVRCLCDLPSSGMPPMVSGLYASLRVFFHFVSCHRLGNVCVSPQSPTHGEFRTRPTGSAANSLCASVRRCRTWSICRADPSRTEYGHVELLMVTDRNVDSLPINSFEACSDGRVPTGSEGLKAEDILNRLGTGRPL